MSNPSALFLNLFTKTAAVAAVFSLAFSSASAAPLPKEVEYIPEITKEKAASACSLSGNRDRKARIIRFICGRKELYVCDHRYMAVSTTQPDGMRKCISLRANRYD